MKLRFYCVFNLLDIPIKTSVNAGFTVENSFDIPPYVCVKFRFYCVFDLLDIPIKASVNAGFTVKNSLDISS
jgi:hypothetical protein